MSAGRDEPPDAVLPLLDAEDPRRTRNRSRVAAEALQFRRRATPPRNGRAHRQEELYLAHKHLPFPSMVVVSAPPTG